MKKTQRLLALVLMLCLALTSAVAFAVPAVDKAKESVVRILAYGTLTSVPSITDGDGNTWILAMQEVGFTGSAFAVGNPGEPVKYFVTNKHCVSFEFPYTNASTGETVWVPAEPDKTEFYIVYDNINNALPAIVTATSDRADLAVVEIETGTELRPAAVLRPFEADKLGSETIYAAGFPGVAEILIREDVQNTLPSKVSDITVTDGLINKVMSGFNTDAGEYLHISAGINSGNSGGPVFDKDGYVLGVATSGAADDNNMNHAVSVNEVIRLLKANDIPYKTATGGNANILPYAIAGGIVVLALAAMLLLRGKKGSSASGSAARSLSGTKGALAGRTFALKGELLIGTNPACQIVCPKGTPGVSGKHVTIKNDRGTVTVTDHNSTYGTWIDSTKLNPGQPTVMHRGQTLSLGSPDQAFTLMG